MNASPSPEIRKTARLSGAAYLAISQATVVALGYVTHVLVGKIGGPPLYGLYGLILSLMTIINLPLAFGIPIATSKEVAEDEQNSGSILAAAARAQFLFALVLALTTVLLAVPIATLLGDQRLIPLIRFAALIAPAQATYALLTNYFNGLHAFAFQARLVIFYSIFKLLGSLGFLVWFRSVTGALAGFIVGGLLATLVGLPKALASVRGRRRARVPARRLFVFAGTFLGMSVALQVLISLDLFLVKRLLLSDTLVGYYTAATTIARMPFFILQGLGSVFIPSVAQLLSQDATRARAFMRKVFRYLFLLLLPIAALSATTSKALLHLFFSAAYFPAARSLTILSLGFGLLSAFYLLATIAAGAGKSRIPLVIACVLIPLDGLLGVALIPRYGLTGAAVMTLLTAGSGATVLGGYMYRRFRLTFPIATLLRGLTATAMTILPTYFVTPARLLLPFWYALLFGVYLLTLYALGEIQPEDWRHARTLVPGAPAGARRRAGGPPSDP